MPCHDPQDDIQYASEQSDRIDKLTRMLCELNGNVDIHNQDGDSGTEIPRSKELQKWWDKHKKEDARRKAAEAEVVRREQVRKDVLSRLTKEERAAFHGWREE